MARPARWRELLDLIDWLPSACRLREAILNDPDEAAAIVRAEDRRREADFEASLRGGDVDDLDDEQPADDGRSWRPRHSEWDTDALLLASIHGAVVNLSSKTPRPKGWRSPGPEAFFPAPRSLVDELRDRGDREAADVAMSIFAPNAPA